MLIPLCDDYFKFGYWKHWFCNRELCIVQWYSPFDSLTQYAMILQQLALSRSMSRCDEEWHLPKLIDPNAWGLSESDVAHFTELNLAASSDKPCELSGHRVFSGSKPLNSFETYDGPLPGYTGDFPTAENFDSLDLTQYCSFEFPEALQPALAARSDCPEWLKPEFSLDGVKFVDAAIKRHDYRAAWRALNSGEWDYSEWCRCIQRIRPLFPEPGCQLQLELWLSSANAFQSVSWDSFGLLLRFVPYWIWRRTFGRAWELFWHWLHPPKQP